MITTVNRVDVKGKTMNYGMLIDQAARVEQELTDAWYIAIVRNAPVEHVERIRRIRAMADSRIVRRVNKRLMARGY